MSHSEHRVGVKEANLVVRHLKLEGVTADNQQQILDEIDVSYGVQSVSFDESAQTLHVAYDATHCELDGIEEILRHCGADIAHDWWTQLKEAHYQFVDDNVRENATRMPWSCHLPHQNKPGKK